MIFTPRDFSDTKIKANEKQVKEYKDYISSIKDKAVNIYLYSIYNKSLVKLD